MGIEGIGWRTLKVASFALGRVAPRLITIPFVLAQPASL